MDQTSLQNQFVNCATILGHSHQGEVTTDPARGLFRIQQGVQDHFVEIFKIVVERGFGIATLPEKPELALRGGKPYQGELFIHMQPHTDLEDRFVPFATAMEKYHDKGLNAGIMSGEYVMQFKGADMYEMLPDILKESKLTHDEHILRHTKSLYHLLDRSRSYQPANALN